MQLSVEFAPHSAWSGKKSELKLGRWKLRILQKVLQSVPRILPCTATEKFSLGTRMLELETETQFEADSCIWQQSDQFLEIVAEKEEFVFFRRLCMIVWISFDKAHV